jgi:hypothetical protein
MAGTVPIITPGSITGLSGKQDRPVFFVKLNGSATPNLVIKGDAVKPHSEVSIKWGSKLMKNVQNSLVNTKIMTAPEVAVFKQAAAAAFQVGTPQQGMSTGVYCWVKMPFVPGLTDADFYNDDYSINLKKVKELIQKFSDAAVWTELGRVVAVDIFNGNSDRFVVNTDGSSKAGDWQNLGNIMFLGAGHGHTTPVIGLDIFDPNSQVSNLQSGGGFEGLKVLIDPNKRDDFALACVRSVGRMIKGKLLSSGHHHSVRIAAQGADGPVVINIRFDTMEHLFDGYAVDFAWGLALGAKQLKDYLHRKAQQYVPGRPIGGAPARPSMPLPGMAPARPRTPIPGFQGAAAKTMPQGVLDRMTYLGW